LTDKQKAQRDIQEEGCLKLRNANREPSALKLFLWNWDHINSENQKLPVLYLIVINTEGKKIRLIVKIAI